MTALDQLVPPNVLLKWTAASPPAGFVAYNIYRRPAGMPVRPWIKIGRIAVPPVGLTAAQVSANHTSFVDYEAGWLRDAGGQWEAGWEYAITVTDAKGLESLYGTILSPGAVPAARNAWITCNEAPWLNAPLQVVPAASSSSDARQIKRTYTGRDLSVVRTPKELPGRNLDADGSFYATVGPDQLRYLRNAEASGRQVSLMRQNGDKITGALAIPKWNDAPDGAQYQQAQLQVVETARAPSLAEYNRPAGIILNGSSQYATTPDDTRLNPGGSPFTIIMAAIFPGTNGVVHLSKGNLGTTDGYGFRNDAANRMQFFIDGSFSSSGPNDPTWPFDGNMHVAVGAYTSGTAKLYRDGGLTPIASSIVAGTVTNAVALIAGANNAGASGFSALAPLHAWAYYPRELTAAEAQAAAYYLLGYPGYRMPAGAVQFIDARDVESNPKSGTFVDLAGNGLSAVAVAAPVLSGYPSPLQDVERF